MNFNIFQPKVPLIDGPRETPAKPLQLIQPHDRLIKMVIGGENSKPKNEKQNRTPGKIEEKSDTKRDNKPRTKKSKDEQSTIAVGNHKVPLEASPRLVVMIVKKAVGHRLSKGGKVFIDVLLSYLDLT